MKLQLAMDDITLEDAVDLVEQVADCVDIVEIGTPFVIEYGMEAVRTIRKRFPRLEILCDAKIMDGGTLEARSAFRAGADYVVVLGVTDQATVKGVVQTAREYGKTTVVDLMCVEDFEKTVPVLEDLGADMLAVHVGVDQQATGRTPLSDLIAVKAVARRAKVAVAGGIGLENLADYIAQGPDVIIVGGAILNAADPAAEARAIYEVIRAAR